MGRKIILTGTKLTDTAAPKLINVDAIESAGSLLLVDFTHPAGAIPSGVPVDGLAVPNLLGDTGSALAGRDVTPTITNSGWAAGLGINERTGRGGWHTSVSPTLSTTAQRARINLGPGARAYLHANQTHRFYISIWARITKMPSNNAKSTHIIAASSSAGNNYLTWGRHDILLPGGSTVYRGASSVGPRLDALSVAAWTGTPPASPDTGFLAEVPNPGLSAFAFDNTLVRQTGGGVLYRHYIEDLTVSGRSPAEVGAIDNELYTREVLTPGGRYYGDTFTDPATVA